MSHLNPSHTRRRVLSSAASLFAKHGYNATAMHDVSHLAGVNESTLFRHFPRKLDLYLAALDCTASRSELKLKKRHWRFLILVAVLLMWTFLALAQQRDSMSGDELGAVSSMQDVNEPSNDTADTPANSADRIISILRENSEALSTVKNEIAHRVSVDPATINDDAVYTHIRNDADLRARIAQELSARGYDLNGGDNSDDRGSGGSRERRTDRLAGPRGARPTLERRNDGSQSDRRNDKFSRREQETGAEDEPGAELRQRPYPYPLLPSLKDLYSQFPASQGKLKRFGSDIFRRGTGNSNELPMDLPMGPDYVLGPGDALVLNLWGSTSQRLNRTIDRQGQIALPEAGPISIAGFTIAHAQESIQQALNGQFKNTRVEISLGRVRTVRVYVVGDVQRPGAYDISALSTPLNALYAAGGPTSRGSLRTLRQYRGEKLVREIDLYELLLRGIRSDADHLLPGDTILVPTIGPQVTVSGMVRRPAIYELKGEQDMKEVLDLAGGVLVSGTLREISVDRIEAHERRTMLSVQLPQGGAQDTADSKLAGFHVQDGDQVLVSPILPYNEKTVYLEGHVFRPGKYAYRDGMTVNDLLRSYQDVMPEPAEHAEIIRLQPPDFRPATVSFSLSEILSGDDPISLRPFDVIRVFSRYEIDPPEVFIYGEVLRPGKYPLASGMTAAGLVQMAGGFKRSAYLETADLSSYVVQDGQNVLTQQKAVQLGKALEGDRSADVVLKPGDVLSIRQLTGWSDIGASVSVKGEVAHVGTYGIREGERLSSVLKRAGGFRNTSFPAGAMLERTEVRELGEKTRLELIRRIEATNTDSKTGLSNSQEQLGNMQAMQQQRQQVLESLRTHHASGRLVINIGPDISKWENTPADVEMRAGDTFFIPKRPDFVVVSGQVFNASAITYEPGRQAGWYLRQAGGPTQTANKKSIFVLRADGAVLGGRQGLWKGSVLDVPLQPGDSIVVPEKIAGGSQLWKNLLGVAQLASSAAVTSAVVTQF